MRGGGGAPRSPAGAGRFSRRRSRPPFRGRGWPRRDSRDALCGQLASSGRERAARSGLARGRPCRGGSPFPPRAATQGGGDDGRRTRTGGARRPRRPGPARRSRRQRRGRGRAGAGDGANRLAWVRGGEWLEGVGEPVLLGLDGGDARFAVDVSDVPEPAAASLGSGSGSGIEFQGLRTAAPNLPAGDAAIAAQARSLLGWHERHPFCAACGAATRPRNGGGSRACAECGGGALSAHRSGRHRGRRAWRAGASRALGPLPGQPLLRARGVHGARGVGRGGRPPGGRGRGGHRGGGGGSATSSPSPGRSPPRSCSAASRRA